MDITQNNFNNNSNLQVPPKSHENKMEIATLLNPAEELENDNQLPVSRTLVLPLPSVNLLIAISRNFHDLNKTPDYSKYHHGESKIRIERVKLLPSPKGVGSSSFLPSRVKKNNIVVKRRHTSCIKPKRLKTPPRDPRDGTPTSSRDSTPTSSRDSTPTVG